MILGWDIGGVAVKVAAVDGDRGDVLHPRTTSVPCEIRYDVSGLAPALASAAQRLGVDAGCASHAVTMTAELSRAFLTKREGVGAVLDALQTITGAADVRVYTTDGHFITPDDARAHPGIVAAANWHATATLVAATVPHCLLIDVGSTSTDIIPIVDGVVVARGRTDPGRLVSGELVYSGAVRTPAEALVRRVPLHDGLARVAAEGFATTADAHVWRRRLSLADCAAYPRESRPDDRAAAGDRLARLVCADREMLDDEAIDAIAAAIAEAQVAMIADAIGEVQARHAVGRAVVTGLGDFLAIEACHRLGMRVVPLAETLGTAARTAPAAAVALLLHRVHDPR